MNWDSTWPLPPFWLPPARWAGLPWERSALARWSPTTTSALRLGCCHMGRPRQYDLGTAASASQKYVEATSKVTKVAKPAGKAIPVVGFVFDVNEIAVGYNNVDRLKALMAEVKKVHDQLIAKIGRHKAAFAALAVKFDDLNRQMQKRTDGWTAGIR